MTKALIEVKHLKKYFVQEEGFLKKRTQTLKAVDDVSFEIMEGETFGLVGESGCGKSTIGKTLMGLMPPTEGQISFDGKAVDDMLPIEIEKTRKDMQIIFQDPFGSLNPHMTVGEIIDEPINACNFQVENKSQYIKEILTKVGLSKYDIDRYPSEFSGGQRQRIAIARALSVRPKFIMCDEPTSALDVSIQAQIINMIKDLQKEFKLTYLFISHDLSMVRYVSDKIGVMYLGKLVEVTEASTLYSNPKHPYTKLLLSAIPEVNAGKSSRQSHASLPIGEMPSPLDIPSGCRFRTRCKYQMPICQEKEPTLKEIKDKHYVACHL